MTFFPRVVSFLLISTATAVASGTVSVSLDEKTLRSFATQVVAPSFPQAAIAAHHFGVAVAKVQVDTSGSTTSVEIVQSPGPEVSASMLSAIHGWKFSAEKTRDGQPLLYSGKLTYYFVLDHRKPVVYSAMDNFVMER